MLNDCACCVQASSLYLHQEISKDFRESKVLFASRPIADKVFKVLALRGLDAMSSLLRRLRAFAHTGNVVGDLFERWALTILASGGMFEQKCLTMGRPCPLAKLGDGWG